MTADLDRAAFAAWLRAQEPDAVVGVAEDADVCPLAHYLQASGYPEAFVAEVDWAPSYDAPSLPLPEWAYQFVSRTDAVCDVRLPITAADALSLLAEVPE